MRLKELERKFVEHGYVLARTKGGHRIYAKEGHPSIPIPVHGGKKDKDLGLLAIRILKQAGIKD